MIGSCMPIVLFSFHFFKDQQNLRDDPKYPRGDTFAYKEFVILNRLLIPEVEVVEIFDDRAEHIPGFVKLGEKLRQNWPNLRSVVIHDVRQNKNYNL